MDTDMKLTDDQALERLENLDPNDPGVTVRDRSAVADIEVAVRARESAEHRVFNAVHTARERGVTWTEIAQALGVSHQAAMKRYRPQPLSAGTGDKVGPTTGTVSGYRGKNRSRGESAMAKGDVETYHEDGQWKNKVEGSSRAANVHGTKAEAQAKGREMAKDRHVEHVIKKQDGTIGEKNSYGNDPRNVKG